MLFGVAVEREVHQELKPLSATTALQGVHVNCQASQFEPCHFQSVLYPWLRISCRFRGVLVLETPLAIRAKVPCKSTSSTG